MNTISLSKSSLAVPLTRRVAAAAVFGLLAVAPALQAQTTAQNYPNRPIRLIVGFPPGGSSDATARMLGTALSAKLGQPVVVDNKAGANTVIATQYLRSQPADGYTLLSVSSSFAINPALQKLSYNIDTDFAPVALLGIIPLMLVTPNEVSAKSLPELIGLAKAQPGKLPYASYGAGSAGHIASELLLSMAGAEMIHVPYKGTGPALVDVMGNQVTMMMPTVAASNALVKQGKLRAIAVSSAKRVSAVPTIPTIAESGLPGYELVAWETIQAPAGTPPEIVNKLNATIRQIVATPEFHDKLIALGIEPDTGKTPAEVGKFVQAEAAKFAKVIKDRGIKPE